MSTYAIELHATCLPDAILDGTEDAETMHIYNIAMRVSQQSSYGVFVIAACAKTQAKMGRDRIKRNATKRRYVCSFCATPYMATDSFHEYCPNCGA